MFRCRLFPIALVILLATLSAVADSGSEPDSAPQPMSPQNRLMVIRSLSAEFVFARRELPMGLKGIVIKDGKIASPTEEELKQLVAQYGPAAKIGDRVQITNVIIKNDRIICELNGGPKKKAKWYDHVQVGMGGGANKSANPDATANPRGSLVELEFHKYVPEMSGDQVRELLSPVLDFHAKSAAETYLDVVPPKVKEAIKNHEVLVGMNHEMVTIAKGRPEKRMRENDEQGKPYEEWMYGEPPKEVQFVRFVGDEVVRLELMKVDGQKIVRTEKEVDVKSALAAVKKEEPKPGPKPANAPTLRRPGEPAPEPPSPAGASPQPKSVGRPGDIPPQEVPRLPPPGQAPPG